MQIMRLDLQDGKGDVIIVVSSDADAERIMRWMRDVQSLLDIVEVDDEYSREKTDEDDYGQ